MAAGDFSDSQLAELQLTVEKMWNEERTRREFEPDTDTTKAIIERQTADVAPVVGTTSREDTVSVKFIKTEGISSTGAVTSECEPDGDELESGKKDYTLNITREAEIFKVKHWQALRDNVFDPEQVIAKGLLKQRKLLDDYINQAVLTNLGTFAGSNALPNGYYTGFDTSTDPTYIADNKWNADLFMELQIMAKFNKFANPFFIHGKNYNAISKGWVFDALNDDQKDKVAKFRVFDHFFDPLTFNELAINDYSYMIDAGSVAFASKAYFPVSSDTSGNARPAAVKELMADKWGFAFPSTIPGVFHDVTVSRTCVSGGSGKPEEFVYTFQMRTKAGLFNAPEIVTGDTGVIEIIKGTRPEGSGS
jgi:hypothetical protein